MSSWVPGSNTGVTQCSIVLILGDILNRLTKAMAHKDSWWQRNIYCLLVFNYVLFYYAVHMGDKIAPADVLHHQQVRCWQHFKARICVMKMCHYYEQYEFNKEKVRCYLGVYGDECAWQVNVFLKCQLMAICLENLSTVFNPDPLNLKHLLPPMAMASALASRQ